MWVKTNDHQPFDSRVALAEITRHDLINAGVAEKGFLTFLQEEVDEGLIRHILEDTYGSVESWTLHCINFDSARFRYVVVVSSPEFGPVTPDGTPRILDPKPR